MGVDFSLVHICHIKHFGLHFEETQLLLLSHSEFFLNLESLEDLA